MQIESLLTSELQLGQQLNKSVKTGERADFALLLAMLSPDVSEQDQFHFETTDTVEKKESLSELFEVPRAQHLTASGNDQEQSLALGKLAQEQGTLAARLSHCLNPEALSFALDKTHDIDRQVYDSLDYHTAANFSGKHSRAKPADIDLAKVLFAQKDYQAQLIA